MFLNLMDGLAWIAIAGIAVVALMFFSAGAGRLIGGFLALFRRS